MTTGKRPAAGGAPSREGGTRKTGGARGYTYAEIVAAISASPDFKDFHTEWKRRPKGPKKKYTPKGCKRITLSISTRTADMIKAAAYDRGATIRAVIEEIVEGYFNNMDGRQVQEMVSKYREYQKERGRDT